MALLERGIIIHGHGPLARLKHGPLLLVEREGLLQPAKRTALLLDRARAVGLVHGGRRHDAAERAAGVLLVEAGTVDGPGRVRALLEGRVRRGLHGAEVLAL